jgi:hypothetical protein
MLFSSMLATAVRTTMPSFRIDANASATCSPVATPTVTIAESEP